MQLSNRELKLVQSMRRHRKNKHVRLVTVLALFLVYVLLRFSGILEDVEVSVDFVVYMSLLLQLPEISSIPTPDERYLDLLRRYIDNDAQTIEALAQEQATV